MFKAWLGGIVGTLLNIVSTVLIIAALVCFGSGLGGTGTLLLAVAAFGFAGAAYLKYLSRQTVRVRR